MLGMTLPPCCPYQPRRSVSPHQSLATIHAAFARKVRARPSGCSTLEAIWVHLRYGPVTRLPSLRDGFVNRLQDYQFPSFLLFKLRGSGLLPRWDSHPLFMPAFAGRTLLGPYVAPTLRWKGDFGCTESTARGVVSTFQLTSVGHPETECEAVVGKGSKLQEAMPSLSAPPPDETVRYEPIGQCYFLLSPS